MECIRVLLSIQWACGHSPAKFENPPREEVEGGGEDCQVDRHQLLGSAPECGENSPDSVQAHERLPGDFSSKCLSGHERPCCRSGRVEPPHWIFWFYYLNPSRCKLSYFNAGFLLKCVYITEIHGRNRASTKSLVQKGSTSVQRTVCRLSLRSKHQGCGWFCNRGWRIDKAHSMSRGWFL